MFRRSVAPGLELRQFEMSDAETALAVIERNRAYLREWLPWVDHTHSAGDLRDFIAHTLSETDTGQGLHTAIWMNGELAGSIGYRAIDWPNRSCSIGYWLDAARQGAGVMTRCCGAMLDHLFQEMRLHRVEIRCGTGNYRSCAIPARLGFTREGVVREAEWVGGRWVDLVIWGMLEQDWRAPGFLA